MFGYGTTIIATIILPSRGMEISRPNWEFVKYITVGGIREKSLKLRKPTDGKLVQNKSTIKHQNL
jgi:hypothetical protein